MQRKHDFIIVISLLLLLALLCWYSYAYNPERCLADCLADPARYDGVVFAPSSKYGLFPGEDDQVLLWHHGVAAPLHGVPAGWQDADYVDLRAIFHEEGYLEVEEIRLSHVRKWRIRASAVAIMLVAGLTLWRFRLDWRRGVLEVR